MLSPQTPGGRIRALGSARLRSRGRGCGRSRQQGLAYKARQTSNAIALAFSVRAIERAGVWS
jgi:hypothetical protein